MTFVLGALIALSMKSEKLWERQTVGADNATNMVTAIIGLKARVSELQNENANMLKGRAATRSEILKELDHAQVLAGLVPVKGPGIIVTLQDSKSGHSLPFESSDVPNPYIIHDIHLRQVITELDCSGAEAIAINDERVVSTTPIRCVGSAIQVNGVPESSPYHIRVIGAPADLESALKLQNGVVDNFNRTDPSMISIARSSNMELPAFSGMKFRYAQPVAQSESSK
jgi:uncharacterized protein YlxW (UPF0749 family)